MDFNKNSEEIMNYFTTSGAFLTSEANGKINTMTISWGSLGFLWGKPYFTVYVRPQRYTRSFIDKSNNFTISVPLGNLKEELGIVGTKSGTEIDKSKIVNFIPAKSIGSPIVEGCGAYFECIVKHVQQFDDSSLNSEIKEAMYQSSDYHFIYFGEIIERY